jgi:hypothetical protein
MISQMMIGIVANNAIAAIELQRHIAGQREKALDGLPQEQAEAMREKWRAEDAAAAQRATEERRHQELCQAIRDSRPRGIGVFW